jgi:hypothetical protein
MSPAAGAEHHCRPTCRISPEDLHHDTSFAGRLVRPFVVEPQKIPCKKRHPTPARLLAVLVFSRFWAVHAGLVRPIGSICNARGP